MKPSKNHPIRLHLVIVTDEHPEVAAAASVLTVAREAPQRAVGHFCAGGVI